jgi:glucose-6-phosphate isomerase
MANLSLNYQNILEFLDESQIFGLQMEVNKFHQLLMDKQGEGSEYLGWLKGPSMFDESLLDEILEVGGQVRSEAEAMVCVGIGGSYLGAKAGIEFLSSSFPENIKGVPQILFAGHNIDSDYMADLLELIDRKNFFINVISKSGTTTEPALAFRLLKDALIRKYGHKEAKKRILVTTDKEKGALKSMADEEGFRSFEIPGDIGGRFSVLTPVGLLPMAVAGIDVKKLLDGAAEMEAISSKSAKIEDNTAYLYASIRNLLYRQGKSVELLSSFNSSLKYVQEWWKQLAGESEGKDQKGIFPASVEFTTDLHSMGQWIQQGNRIIFETFITLKSSKKEIRVPEWGNDLDDLNYLAGKSLDFINDKAWQGTAKAHKEGGVPNMTITLSERSPQVLGSLFYFFEKAIAMSGHLLGVNPFDQPGVEMYKKKMFTLLNKPGY